MQFIVEGHDAVVQAIAARLRDELGQKKQVLWLVSGGSNVTLQVSIMQQLHDGGVPLERLTILPMDERYGPPGHINSNSQAMRDAGFMPGRARWLDILAQNVSFSETIAYYNTVAAQLIGRADSVVGQFGLGTDGHVAGILPGSPACSQDYATVIGYEWSDYVRLTLSPRTLAEAVSVAYLPAVAQTP